MQRLTVSGFMEKPGIKPATPGLQGIGLSPTPWPLKTHFMEVAFKYGLFSYKCFNEEIYLILSLNVLIKLL